MEYTNIAVLLTCHNRKKKTLAALKSLYKAETYYNISHIIKIKLDVFLTDDGCTDGTIEAVLNEFTNQNICIVESDGNAYWAGGMRLAWSKAIGLGNFLFYLLINDDVILKDDCFVQLMETDKYCREKFNKGGVYTAFLADPKNHNLITYGAEVYRQGLLKSTELLKPIGCPQICEMPNANILCVSKEVVSEIGILSDAYIHGAADWDYGIRATRAGFPVLTTSTICGYCENDHDSRNEEAAKVLSMSFTQRKLFLNKPTRQYADGFAFFYKYNKLKFVIMKLGYFINLYFPKIFYIIYSKRKTSI